MSEPFIDTSTAANFIGIRRNTLVIWVRTKGVPHYKIGGLLKFRLSELSKWAEEKKRFFKVRSRRG